MRWWRETVSPRESAGSKSGADLRSTLSKLDAENLTGISHQQVSRWAKRLKDIPQYREMLFGAAYKKAMMSAENHRAGSGEDEWYTPELEQTAIGAANPN